jgi:cytochrome bd-type quinol oxidase subunit 2
LRLTNPSRSDQTATRVNRLAVWIPFLCSGVAFGIVMANIIAGVQPQSDENASAHLWQLLMVAQLAFMVVFVATANWRHSKRQTTIVALQLAAFVAAALPVWLAGY